MTLREIALERLAEQRLMKAVHASLPAFPQPYQQTAPEVQDVPQLGKLLFHCSLAEWEEMKRLVSGRMGFNCSDLALTAILLWARWGVRMPTTTVDENNWRYIYEAI